MGQDPAYWRRRPPALSIVIPALNERANIARLVPALRADDPAAEIIVVDGGSADGTVAAARHAGARVLRSKPGRGGQLGDGAHAAEGAILLFLHADSHPARGALRAVAAGLASHPAAVGGNFRLLFDGGTAFDRRLTRFYGWIRARGLYYGDSGIFVRRGAYHAIGGIRPMALMEDYDFVRRLERTGATICIDDPPLVTSSRKFAGRSAVAIVAGWLWIHALYHLGVSPDRLARMYYGRWFRQRGFSAWFRSQS